MKKRLASLLPMLLICLPLSGWGQEHAGHPPDEPVVEHVELLLPKGLLEGYPVLEEDLTLPEAIEIGLENNLNLKVAHAEADYQKALLKEARGERWPVLSLGSLTFLRGGDNLTMMTPWMMMNTVDTTLFQDFNATARMPLFTGGRIVGGIRASRYGWEAALANAGEAAVDMAYQIREAYLYALFSKAEHIVHQEHLDVQQELLRIAEARYRVGRGLKADVLRVEAEIASARTMLNEEHSDLNNRLYDLKATMGIDLASRITVTDALDFEPWRGQPLESLVAESVGNHPAVQEAEAEVESARAQITVARSRYFPQVYGQVTGNYRLPDRPEMMGNGVIGMMTAELPVFDRTRGAEVDQAQAQLEKAGQSLRSIQLDLGKTIAQSWNEMLFARENVKLAEAAVEQAAEDLRLIQRRQAVGRALQVEVQDAALSLRERRLERARAILNHELAKARLLRATGQVL